MTDPRRDFAVDVVRTLKGAGHEALFAGGCVRDLLLGTPPSDYDVATSATPDRVLSLFRRTVPVGVSFGVVRVLGPKVAGEVEVATFRSDGAYLDGRRPVSVTFGTAEADARRRDFTINGMFLDPIDDRVIDFVGGREDLGRGILRAIGDPYERFSEDKLRLLRAVRFAARLGFALDDETRRAIVVMANQVRQVAIERIAQELRKMLADPSRSLAVRMAFETGLLAEILPGRFARDGNDTDRVSRVVELLPPSASFPLAMAALQIDRDPESAQEATARASAELKLSNAERDRISWLVGSLARLERFSSLSRSEGKRLLAAEGIGELLALGRAVALAETGDDSHVRACEIYLRDQPDGPIDPPPLLSGSDLIAHGYRPGPGFAELLESVRDAQLEGTIRDKDEALRWLGSRPSPLRVLPSP